MSSSVRVNTLTSPPRRWTWIRIPSIFHSAAATDSRSNAEATLDADAASIGRSGLPTCKPTERSAAEAAAGPAPASAISATPGSDPPSRKARRTSSVGTAGRAGHGLDHEAFQGTLVQVTGDQPDQERALARRGPFEQGRQQPTPVRLGAGPGGRADGREDGVCLGQGDGRLRSTGLVAVSAPATRCAAAGSAPSRSLRAA